MRKFIQICKKNQEGLKDFLEKKLRKKYQEVINEDGFLYARGNIPVLLTAHMDTVHKETCKTVTIKKADNKTILSSPQGIGGDDRCGVWIILGILKETDLRPYIIFCEDEEIGGIGSNKFINTRYADELTQMKYLVELDRANYDDAVYYDCGNQDFADYIEEKTGYTKAHGSFSDISHLSPDCDVASVNLSCGYYKAHTVDEYVVLEEMRATKEKVKELLEDIDNADAFDYQEVKFDWYKYYDYNYGYGYDYGYGYGLHGYSKDKKNKMYEIVYNNYDKGTEECYTVYADSYEEAVGCFLIDYPDMTYAQIIEVQEY